MAEEKTGTDTNPAGTGGADTNQSPGGTDQNLVSLELSGDTRFDVSPDFAKAFPDQIKKSYAEKDKTIAQMKEKIASLERNTNQFENLGRVLTEQFSKGGEEPIPDPIDDPKGYASWVRDDTEKAMDAKTKKANQLWLTTVSETSLLRDLVGGDREKYKKVIDHADALGLTNKEGDLFHLKEGAARLAFRDLYWDQSQAQAKGEGLNQIKSDLDRAATAPTGQMGTGAMTKTGRYGGYSNAVEWKQKDPDGFYKARDKASVADKLTNPTPAQTG